MVLHMTRVDDVMCLKHLPFLSLVHQETLGIDVGEK